SLARVLGAMLQLPVRVHSFARRWLVVGEEFRARLGACTVGGPCAIGARALDYEGTYEIEIGPVSRASLPELLPGARLHQRISQISRFAVGTAKEAILRIRVGHGQSPRLQLSASTDQALRLGCNTWINGNNRFWSGGHPTDLPEAEAVFRISAAGA
ncbi:MAG: type VI secretion system baseplate subunit TssG, partial [Gemmatimonadaceae bacterium]